MMMEKIHSIFVSSMRVGKTNGRIYHFDYFNYSRVSHLPVAVTVNNFSLSGYETVILHWAALQEGNS